MDLDSALASLATRRGDVPSLRALRAALPEAAPRLRRSLHLLAPLCCSGDAALAEEAEALLAALAPEEATFAGGARRFSWRGVEVDFYELEEDPQTDLLFGYGLWPVASSLAKLLTNAALDEEDSEVQGHPIPSVKAKSILEIGGLAWACPRWSAVHWVPRR
ncbi:dnaJ [Symbiodinium sp. CCMP2456]|nr:dnaJ [Symbiodinium sp. CCMP2456]